MMIDKYFKTFLKILELKKFKVKDFDADHKIILINVPANYDSFEYLDKLLSEVVETIGFKEKSNKLKAWQTFVRPAMNFTLNAKTVFSPKTHKPFLVVAFKEMNFVSESRRRRKSKKQNPEAEVRSQFLKALMPKVSGDRGNKLASAFVNGDAETVRSMLTETANEIANSISKS